jgi:hypothetical protein
LAACAPTTRNTAVARKVKFKAMSEPVKRPLLTLTQCQIMDEVVRCNPHGWHPHPEALGAAEELKARGWLTRRMVDVNGPQAIYYLTPEFKAAAIIDGMLGSQIGSMN